MHTRLKRAFCILLIASTVTLSATVMVPVTQEALVQESDLVVQGRVVELRSFWNKERTTIVTEARLQVEEAVVGAPASFVSVRLPGGRVGKYTVELVGGPRLAKGERQILFLKKHRDGALRVVALQQGQYRLQINSAGVEMAVSGLEPGPNLVTPDGEQIARPKAVPAAQLKRQIRETAARVGRPIER